MSSPQFCWRTRGSGPVQQGGDRRAARPRGAHGALRRHRKAGGGQGQGCQSRLTPGCSSRSAVPMPPPSGLGGPNRAAVRSSRMFGRPDRARYGIDGGFIALSFYAALSGPLVAASLSARRRGHPGLARLAAAGLAAVACSEASFLYSTGPGKRSIWSELLNALDLEGDEHVLDVGCGRGAVLIAAAHRLPKGRAVGVDIWRRRDQSGNRRSATEHNSVVEGVAERVELVDGDARDLPVPARVLRSRR